MFWQDFDECWDWEEVKRHAEVNEGYCYIGTVMSLLPSGKFYTAWANTNVASGEAYLDTLWMDALSAIAEEKGFSVTSDEGDPCDMYLFCSVDCVNDADEESDE